jgi:hypothetical protein
MSILFDPRFWLAVVLWTAVVAFGGYWKGGKDERADWTAKQLQAERAARETEQEITRMNNRATADYVARIRKQQEKARALPPIILTEDCRVPAAIGRVLNDAQRLPDDAGTESDPGRAAQTVDSTCAAELNIAKRNYAEVCIPAIEQVKEIQRQWESTRALINKHSSTHSTSP